MDYTVIYVNKNLEDTGDIDAHNITEYNTLAEAESAYDGINNEDYTKQIIQKNHPEFGAFVLRDNIRFTTPF